MQLCRLSKYQAKSCKKAGSSIKAGTATEKDTLNEWKSYFSELLNAKSTTSSTKANEPILTSRATARIQPDNIRGRINTGPFTFDEVKVAVKGLKNNKAPGVDNIIRNELLKNGGDCLLEIIRLLCSQILSGTDPPWQFTTNKVVPVPKKGDLSLMTNYRGISLMSAMAKIYNRLLLNRIRPIVDQILRRNQAGFRAGRSTISQIAALRRLFEGAVSKKLPLVAIFVDFKKAFDSINREMLFQIMLAYGIPDQIVAATRKLYDNSKAMVVVNGKMSETFAITTGVLQGDTLAPFLFIMVIDYVMSNSEEDFGFIYAKRTSSRHPAKTINDLDFADDIALLENSIALANKQLQKLALVAKEVGLEINIDKTEYIIYNINNEEERVILNNQELKKVDDFRYLGSMMKSTESDFERRRGLAYGAWNSMEKIWSAKHIPIKLKVNIFDASVLSILLYGCETWIITPKLEQRINSFATNCYRQMLNIKRVDKVKLDNIYAQVNKRPLINTINKRQLGWLGHTLRRDKDEPTTILALYEPAVQHGQAKRGPKSLTYTSQISKLITGAKSDMTSDQINAMAQDRNLWKRIINDQDKPPKP